MIPHLADVQITRNSKNCRQLLLVSPMALLMPHTKTQQIDFDYHFGTGRKLSLETNPCCQQC